MNLKSKTPSIAAAILAANASALKLSVETEAQISECYLTKYPMITREGWDGDDVRTIDNYSQLTVFDSVYPNAAQYELDGISVCLESPEGHNNHAHRAIRGLRANLISKDGQSKRYPNAIGDMMCEDDSYRDLMHINGPEIGRIKMKFETDGDAGVAIQLKERVNNSWAF